MEQNMNRFPERPPENSFYPKKTKRGIHPLLAFFAGALVALVAFGAAFLLLRTDNAESTAPQQDVKAALSTLASEHESDSSEKDGDFVLSQRFFDTPEEAYTYFIEAVRDARFDDALSAFALKSKAENFDTLAQADRLNVYRYGAMPDYDAYLSLDTCYFAGQTVRQITFFVSSVLADQEIYNEFISSGLLQNDGDHGYQEFFAELDPTRLSDLKLVRITPVKDLLEAENYEIFRENERKICAVYGAEDSADFEVTLTLNGQYYKCSFKALQYTDGWRIDMLCSPVLGYDSLGSAVLVDEP